MMDVIILHIYLHSVDVPYFFCQNQFLSPTLSKWSPIVFHIIVNFTVEIWHVAVVIAKLNPILSS